LWVVDVLEGLDVHADGQRRAVVILHDAYVHDGTLEEEVTRPPEQQGRPEQ
jgi:hypothetical protein